MVLQQSPDLKLLVRQKEQEQTILEITNISFLLLKIPKTLLKNS